MKKLSSHTERFKATLFFLLMFTQSYTMVKEPERLIPSSQQSASYNAIDKELTTPDSLLKWQVQLEDVMKKNDLLSQLGLKLTKYKFRERIETIEELEAIKRQIIDEQKATGNIRKEDVQGFKSFIDLLLPTTVEDKARVLPILSIKDNLSAKVIYLFEKDDLSYVTLYWIVNREPKETTCLVSDKKGIIYDNILYFTPMPSSADTSTPENVSQRVRGADSVSTIFKK